jgi:hypothetical protein
MSDERLYARVVEELRAAGPTAGLWAKAFAESGGDDRAAKAAYLRLRVAQLAAEEASTQKAQSESAQAKRLHDQGQNEGGVPATLVVVAVIVAAWLGLILVVALKQV